MAAAEKRSAERRGVPRGTRRVVRWFGTGVLVVWWAVLWIRIAGLPGEAATGPEWPGVPPAKNSTRSEKATGGGDESSLCSSFLANTRTHLFRPKRFFEEGLGQPFLDAYHHNERDFPDILNTRFLLFQIPNITGSDECSLLHYHIHKNGGTTLERHVPLPTDNYYSKREKAMGHTAFEAACETVMAKVYRQQQKQQQVSRRSIRAFTFLRDPVPRFLSSVAQILKLKVWHKRLHPCYELNSTGELLDCVLDKLETGSIPEMHLSPQSFELYKQVMGFDIEIESMDLSEIGNVMTELGAADVPKERSTMGTLIRRFPRFQLTMDALNEARIERICTIYAADVEMLREARVTKTLCIPQN